MRTTAAAVVGRGTRRFATALDRYRSSSGGGGGGLAVAATAAAKEEGCHGDEFFAACLVG